MLYYRPTITQNFKLKLGSELTNTDFTLSCNLNLNLDLLQAYGIISKIKTLVRGKKNQKRVTIVTEFFSI